MPKDAPKICKRFLESCTEYTLSNFDRRALLNMDETSIYIDSSGKLNFID